MTDEEIKREVEHRGLEALGAIDKLVADLQDNRKRVEAWMAGEPARTPKIYGNALGDAADAVAAFRETANVYGQMWTTDKERIDGDVGGRGDPTLP